MNRTAAAYYTGLVLVIGGFGAIGAAAGLRVAIGLTTQTLACGFGAVDCAPLLAVLNDTARTFLIGGAVAMICGSIGLWGVRQSLDAPEASTTDA